MSRAAPLGLLKFIPRVSPKFTSPMHLRPFVELLERTDHEECFACVDTPPRHFKTETVKHAVVRRLLARPASRIGYATYSAALAAKKSREMRELYKRAGGHVDADASARSDWRTGVDNGGLWAGGVGGSWTGEGFDLLVIDDAVKDRATAESGVEREKLWDWFRDVAYTRLEPGGSCIVNGTRWHADDLSGRLLADGWDRVHLPAIDDRGRALCPERFPIAKLRQIEEQLGDYGWASLYMGEPFPRGGAVFRDSYFYDVEPTGTLKIRIGVDLAYSAKARADYSVAVVLGELEGRFYVLEVMRVQVTAPDFIRRVAALQARYGGARLCGYFGGTEKATVDTMKEMGLPITAHAATLDKFTRSQPVAAAWNAGKILLPRSAPWLDAFVSEVVSFTGVKDRHDDQVDALAGAYAAVARTSQRKPGSLMGCIVIGGGIDNVSAIGGGVPPHLIQTTDFFAPR